MSMPRPKAVFYAVWLFLLMAIFASAQTFRGAIHGTVTDATGAVIPGAQVKAENTATGLSRESVTTASGDFDFEDLPLGNYTVTVNKPGFQVVKTASAQRTRFHAAHQARARSQRSRIAQRRPHLANQLADRWRR